MSDRLAAYRDFLKAKIRLDEGGGFDVEPHEINPICKPHQASMIAWAVKGGRRAVFASFGLGKTICAIETVRLTLEKSGRTHGLIIMPLSVKLEFQHDAAMLGVEVRFIRSTSEIDGPGIYLTNYESVRDGKLGTSSFGVVSLDEAAILRGLGGTKTFREFMRLFEGSDTYRYVWTALPAPNDYIELLAYSAFLAVLDVGNAKTRFFKRNSEKADQLTIHPHKEKEFWLWVSSWALFLQKPSDIGYSDEGYELPPLDVRWHELPSDHDTARPDKIGQGRLIKDAAYGLEEAAREKRESLPARLAKLMELRAEDPTAHRVIWHHLEEERKALSKAIPGMAAIYGNQNEQPLEVRDRLLTAFAQGETQELAGKPQMLGSGCNLQRHCHWAIFLGIDYKANDIIQAIYRLLRFLQEHTVRVDFIYTEAERGIRAEVERKWKQHEAMCLRMAEIIREFGLSRAAMAASLSRSFGLVRREESGRDWTAVNNDTVEETMEMESDSVGMILTSIPFSMQYEYTPSFNDFGHTDDDEHFFAQMDFLTPELLRVLKPGRVCAIHVKDRVTPGGLTGLGFQSVEPFMAKTLMHFRKHGFVYQGLITVVTDVVRENAQTYRLGWSMQCRDGSRMGCGLPEYLLLFRKAPTDSTDGFADEPVVKGKDEYSRARWQFDAHSYWPTDGNRLLTPADIDRIVGDRAFASMQDLKRTFTAHCLNDRYNYEAHVRLAEHLDSKGLLPPTFMLLEPQTTHPMVWTDVARMLSTNTLLSAKGRELHLCPLPWDIVDRAINRYTNPGDEVYDPFAGVFSVPLRAVKAGRRGRGVDLSPEYWLDGCHFLRQVERGDSQPTLDGLESVEWDERELLEVPA